MDLDNEELEVTKNMEIPEPNVRGFGKGYS